MLCYCVDQRRAVGRSLSSDRGAKLPLAPPSTACSESALPPTIHRDAALHVFFLSGETKD